MSDRAERSLLLSCFHDEVIVEKHRAEEEIRGLKDERMYLQLKIDVLRNAEDQLHQDIDDLLFEIQVADIRTRHELPKLEDKLKTLELKLRLIKQFE